MALIRCAPRGWPGRDAALDRVRLVAGMALGALPAIAANTAELPSALLMALYALIVVTASVWGVAAERRRRERGSPR